MRRQATRNDQDLMQESKIGTLMAKAMTTKLNVISEKPQFMENEQNDELHNDLMNELNESPGAEFAGFQ